MTAETPLPTLDGDQLRARLRAREEVALVDVREEDPFAQAHALFAVQLALGRLEVDASWRLPRRDVTVVVTDDGEGLAEIAARRLQALGYTQVHLLAGGLVGWRDGGGEVFRDVNVPSKAFGELVEHEVGTPSLPAPQVKALLDAGADVVVLDARRYDEYHTMSIPRGVSVPGAELVLRARALAPDPATRIIVNCAGRTRSLIGAQSLVNAGVPNPVAALRNGTIGWTLAGFTLEHGQTRRFDAATDPAVQAAARSRAHQLADQAGAVRLDAATLARWAADARRTLYRWDVRTPEEHAAGHLPGFGSAPGGQLVQETDVFCAVRGARIALADDDGVRAPMTAHWLAQLGWEVGWLQQTPAEATDTGRGLPPAFEPPVVASITPAELVALRPGDDALVLELDSHADYRRGHLPGAWWALRSDLVAAVAQALAAQPQAQRVVLVSESGNAAAWSAADVQASVPAGLPVQVLAGGRAAWRAAGLPLDAGAGRLVSPAIDRYRRPYEGTDNPQAAMQAYLDWEFGLVAQLARDGTHGFRVLRAAA